MAKTLICPTCNGPSINRAPKFGPGPDGVMHRQKTQCYYLGGFSGRKDDRCRSFWCVKKMEA